MVDLVMVATALFVAFAIVIVLDLVRRAYLMTVYPHAYKADQIEDGEMYAAEKREQARQLLGRDDE